MEKADLFLNCSRTRGGHRPIPADDFKLNIETTHPIGCHCIQEQRVWEVESTLFPRVVVLTSHDSPATPFNRTMIQLSEEGLEHEEECFAKRNQN